MKKKRHRVRLHERTRAECPRALAFVLACALAQGGAARDVPTPCEHVQVVLAPGLTPDIVRRDWGSGQTHAQANAVLELRGCAGELLDRLALAAPLATLDPTPLRGTVVPTWLVSADLTAPAGSYSGPFTLPIEVVAHHLHPAVARDAGGHEVPIQLAATGKSAWRRLPTGPVDTLLEVGSAPHDGAFITRYRRYHLSPYGWMLHARQQPGLWESDADFPAASEFP